MLESILTTPMTFLPLVICTAASLVMGCAIAAVFTVRNQYTRGFVMTLIMLPVIVQTVILLVNGNLGAGIASAGAFSLVRFRSVPGTAREICALFQAMALGLATGMGYVGVAVFLTGVLCLVQLALVLRFPESGQVKLRSLYITLPLEADYTGLFDDILDDYAARHELVRVKTTGMGSTYELHYVFTPKDPSQEKAMLDALRTRSENLTVICGRPSRASENL